MTFLTVLCTGFLCCQKILHTTGENILENGEVLQESLRKPEINRRTWLWRTTRNAGNSLVSKGRYFHPHKSHILRTGRRIGLFYRHNSFYKTYHHQNKTYPISLAFAEPKTLPSGMRTNLWIPLKRISFSCTPGLFALFILWTECRSQESSKEKKWGTQKRGSHRKLKRLRLILKSEDKYERIITDLH